MKAVKVFLNKLGIVNRKKKLIPRLIKNYLSLFAGRQVLRTIEFQLLYACQLKCKHCSPTDLVDHNQKRELLSSDEIKKVIDESKQLGAVHVLFTGGETLMVRQKLLELLQYTKEDFISSVDTNGMLLDQIYAEKLQKAGLDVACVSIDFANAEQHDEFRGYKGSFDGAVKAVKHFRKHNIGVMISTLVTKEKLNTGELYRILEMAYRLDSTVIFCLPVITGRYGNNRDERLNSSDFKKMDKVMKHPLARLCMENNYLQKGCAAGSEKIGVTAYGEVMPCTLLKDKFGNIRDESLSVILKRMRLNPLYSKVNKDIKCLAAQRPRVVPREIEQPSEQRQGQKIHTIKVSEIGTRASDTKPPEEISACSKN